ncbi:lytic transglycosylase domain-containing protein [Limobrevibacterium gyesilva]|uniref:Lytic transglycosylase domain-containing protein n=1 Tax=Limobrevibacterium gyesilva TaxID=2991712 RepID=A0AA41YMC3_9PROT|nr:lytic transglycosylase domain-containing protein [Limobrevibacterium gyesilva]MCW3473123.1 lytic transglycosylase domain-containing protein [Limobrevibacterium gyesilva]
MLPNGSDDSALAIPRVSPGAGGGVALPHPLPPSEAARIRRIFGQQARGDIPAALRETAQLDTSTPLGQAMLGHILADRYLGPFTRPGAGELQAWLAGWADLPDASSIHSLLLVRLPRGATAPPAPAAQALASSDARPAPVPEETEPAGLSLARNATTDRAVREAARSPRPYAAARLIAQASNLAPAYAALLRGEAGQILFTLNRDEEAFDTAAAGVRACGRTAPDGCQGVALPAYVAGLAAWRMGRIELARPMFEAAWRAELTTPALKSAAAFWTARARLRSRDPAGYVPWMLRASTQKNTFYGLLARRALGLTLGFDMGDRETLAEADVEAVAATPEGLRAFALLQVGQTARAEAELRRLWPAAQDTPALARAIMLVASRARLTELAAQLADRVQAADGRPRDGTRFPVPRLRPAGGFTIDPAMVYALARTESNFDPAMVSPAGARGLMQIMPETALFILQANRGEGLRSALHDPAVNLDLGQRYVSYLATHDVVNGNLIRLLASYNSGPGNFSRWGPTVRDDGDPLLFIEAIPIDETRAFVPRVLTYTWIYAARMHLPTPSLDELAVGGWPRYHDISAQQEAATRTN